MRKLTFFASIAALAAGLMFVSAKTALADDCAALIGGVPPVAPAPCVVSSFVTATGVYNLDRTLHIDGNGRIDASGVGITLNICHDAPVAGPSCDLILDTPIAATGGQIEANDTGVSGANASPITIKVSRDVLMQAGSAILAENTNDGGNGGNITITAGGDMTMCGQTGAQPGCGAPAGNPGALISSEKTSGAGDTGVGGDITITVGNTATVTGAFYMEGGLKGYGTETGAKILSSGTGPSGDITITPGGSYFTEPGSVVEAGGVDVAPSAVEQGGKIYIVSGCQLTTEGRITSKGPDPGADLVHLEGCEVIIRGLVESTGKGHTVNNDFPNNPNPGDPGPPNNSCDNNADGLTNEVIHSDKKYNATGCIEVWGKVITIDSTNGWAGELNADIGDGGTKGMGWIDIFAFSKLTVLDGTGNDRLSDNLGHEYFSTYAVHANSIDGSDGTPGVVTARVKSGPLTASGKAFEASATMNKITGHDDGNINDEFVGNGSTGGTIDVEASGTVTLDDAWLNASGDFFGGSPCPSGSGACGFGGHINVKAWGVGSDINWRKVDGDVQPNGTGDITLDACDSIDTTGTEFHGEPPATSTGGANCDATKPDIPSYVVFNQTAWALCSESTISGKKYNSDTGAGLPGWTIHIISTTGPAFSATTVTGTGGAYSFNVPGGQTYKVCEVLLDNTWTQTFPVAGPDVVSCNGPGEAPLGYTVDLTTGSCCTGQIVTGKDFGNKQQLPRPPDCPEDPNRAALLTRTVNLSKPNLSGSGVPGDPKNYWLVQAAYNDAKGSAQAEVIGLFANTSENLLLDGYKSLTITQCTVARVTGAAGSPVWDITNTKKLTIISPDSVGGTVGWRVQTNGHDLKSIRATGASQYGIQIIGNSNSVSTNSVSGSPEGIRVEGDNNTIKSGTISDNGIGVHFTSTANGNTLSGSTVRNNTSHGIVVDGSGNKLDSDKVYSNGGDGVRTAATATSTTLKSVGSGSSGENGGAEFRLGATAINGGGNKADGVNVPSAAKGCATFNAGSVCE
jgi:parallel beta-helix repeat protein